MSIETKVISIPEYGCWAEIRLDRLKANLKSIKEIAGSRAGILAVVKANAYGHGIINVAETLDGQVDFLGVSSVLEALELKEHHIRTPIFLFGRLLSSELPSVLSEGITLSVSSLEEAYDIASLSESLHQKTSVHIKVDTGMGRLGIPSSSAISAIEKMSRLSSIDLQGIYTHFPAAERNDAFLSNQVRQFANLLLELEKKGIHFKYRHASNSAASLRIQTPIFNLVRPGISLYGIYPDEAFREIVTLKPLLNLKSRIILLKRLEAGQSVGYGRDYVASKPTTIATLPIGYSHGYPFNASSRAQVLFRGKRFPLAGRVSMDYLAVDLGDTPAKVGDPITLVGDEGDDCIESEELALWSQTIPYEIVTRLSLRVPRLYRI